VPEFIGEESLERTGVVFYGLMLLALDLSFTVFLRYAAERRRLVRKGIDDLVAEEAWQRRPSYAFYAIAIGVGLPFPYGRGSRSTLRSRSSSRSRLARCTGCCAAGKAQPPAPASAVH
jgi:hypothetical protein